MASNGYSISEKLIKDVFNGKELANVNTELYNQTSKILTSAIDQGMNMNFEYDSPDNIMRGYLRNNSFKFSAAKSMSMIQDIKEQLLDSDGKPRTYAAFKKEVLKIDESYNTNWLRAEQQHAIAQAQNASNWNKYIDDKDLYPNLRYQTIEDDRVRPEHESLNGVTLHIDDPLWNTIAPQNGWGCRCSLVQEDEDAELTRSEDAFARSKKANIHKTFKNNPGTSEIIFNEDLPYFKKAGKTKTLKAEDYGMPSISDIYSKKSNLNSYKGSISSPEDYEKWWRKMVEKNGTGNTNEFILQSKVTGYKLVFDDRLKQKPFTTKRAEQKRYKLADEIPSIINDPNEVFTQIKGSKRYKSKLLTTYIRYYNNGVVILIAEDMRVISYYWTEAVKGETLYDFRRGMLEYNKTKQQQK